MALLGRSWGDTPPEEPRSTERGFTRLRRAAAVAGLAGVLGVAGMTCATAASADTGPANGGQHQPNGRAWS